MASAYDHGMCMRSHLVADDHERLVVRLHLMHLVRVRVRVRVRVSRRIGVRVRLRFGLGSD